MLKLLNPIKNFFYFTLVIFCFLSLMACQKKEFRSDTIYLFWQPGCSHCHHAIEYFNNEMPTVRVEMIDISKEDGYKKLIKAVQLYNLGNQIATPLFIVKDKHFVGWSNEFAERLKEIAPYFQK
ncbi:MAG: hypothetical protein J6V53_00545 [Alphaproteobacteria bacterium]|nr:hypothetical protein [Alphaproteobacteria bacterium]